MASWDHDQGTQHDRNITLTPGLDSVQGTFENVRSQPSGLVTVTLIITDDLNRVISDVLRIRIDKDGPTITDDGWTESSDYLHVNGGTLYFSDLMGGTPDTAMLSGHTDDGPNGSGTVGQATFTPEPSLGFSSPNPSLPDWSIQYLISQSSSGPAPRRSTT